MQCPQPVLETKDAITANPDKLIEVTVDNEASLENVTRFLKSRGWEVKTSEGPDNTHVITGAPGRCDLEFSSMPQTGSMPHASDSRVMLLITTDIFGTGSDELGRKLMRNFIMTLKEMDDALWRVVFINGGVKLTQQEAATFQPLRTLEKAGVSILVCGTCLEFFGLMDNRRVGKVTNMLDIITSMELASKVIHI
jgi:selenium metabolism protein YedF